MQANILVDYEIHELCVGKLLKKKLNLWESFYAFRVWLININFTIAYNLIFTSQKHSVMVK